MRRECGSRVGAAQPVFFAHFGEEGIRGSERVLLDLLAHLDRERFRPLVWCNSETMASAVKSLDTPVRVVEMPVLLGWQPPKFALGAYCRLRDEAGAFMARENVAVAHANSGAPNQWLVPAARRARVPVVAHLHAHYVLRDRCTLRLHEATMIVGCSNAVVAPFAAEGIAAQRLRTIPNGVDVARLGAGSASGLRAALGIPDDAVVITAIGALVALKGFDVLLRAAARMVGQGMAVRLLVIGDGVEERALRALSVSLGLSAHVHFLGRRADVGAILRDVTDIVAAPSRQEAFGLTVAEAGVFAKPAVASDVPGLRETVMSGDTGILAPAGDNEALADALARLVADPALRARMGSRAREHARLHFTVDAMASAFADLYSDCIRLPSRPRRGFVLEPWARLSRQWGGNRLRALGQPPASGIAHA